MVYKKSTSSVSLAFRKTLFSLKTDQPLLEKSNSETFTVKVANKLEEREAVYRLAYQIYLEKGYINENPNEWLLQPYDAVNDTVILVVLDSQKNIAGSITILFDSNKKLPADKIYNEELTILRNSGKRLAEISRLVINPQYRNSKEILVLLFNYMAIYTAHVKHASNLVIEVNPRHKEYYKSILCFEEIGSERPCPQVQNAPAVLLNLPLKKYQTEVFRCQNNSVSEKKERTLYPFFLRIEQESLVAQYLEKQTKAMSAEEKIYFGFSESGLDQVALEI